MDKLIPSEKRQDHCFGVLILHSFHHTLFPQKGEKGGKGETLFLARIRGYLASIFICLASWVFF